jgi:hypothetical protein
VKVEGSLEIREPLDRRTISFARERHSTNLLIEPRSNVKTFDKRSR